MARWLCVFAVPGTPSIGVAARGAHEHVVDRPRPRTRVATARATRHVISDLLRSDAHVGWRTSKLALVPAIASPTGMKSQRTMHASARAGQAAPARRDSANAGRSRRNAGRRRCDPPAPCGPRAGTVGANARSPCAWPSVDVRVAERRMLNGDRRMMRSVARHVGAVRRQKENQRGHEGLREKPADAVCETSRRPSCCRCRSHDEIHRTRSALVPRPAEEFIARATGTSAPTGRCAWRRS